MIATPETKMQLDKNTQKAEEILRKAAEFDLYESAKRFVTDEMGEKGYRISKTRLENLSRAFRLSYDMFNRLLNNYLIRLQKEAEETRGAREINARRELDILKKIKAQCSLDILEGIPLGLEEPISRAERKEQSKLKKEYAGELAYAWFTHFVSAYMFGELSW